MAIEPGTIVKNRHHLADISKRAPVLTGAGKVARWVAWGTYGGPIAMFGWATLFVHGFGITGAWLVDVIPMATGIGLVGWWWSLANRAAGQWGPAAGAGFVAGSFGAVAWFLTLETIKIPSFNIGEAKIPAIKLPGPKKLKRFVTGRPGRYGVWLFVWSTMWFTVGTGYTIGLGVVVAVFRFLDALVAEASDWYDGRQQFGEFRQEFPVQWAILAGKSPRVQSIADSSLETQVGEAAVDRPPLEAPPLYTIPRQVSPYVFELPAWRSPGRGLEELKRVVDELAAQFPQIGDWDDSIELIWPNADGTNFASWAWLRVHFKTRDQRRYPFGKRDEKRRGLAETIAARFFRPTAAV